MRRTDADWVRKFGLCHPIAALVRPLRLRIGCDGESAADNSVPFRPLLGLPGFLLLHVCLPRRPRRSCACTRASDSLALASGAVRPASAMKSHSVSFPMKSHVVSVPAHEAAAQSVILPLFSCLREGH